MSTLAKVFVVLNLILAVAFCFVTLTLYAKRVDFKDAWEKEVKAKSVMETEMQGKIDTLTDSLTKTQQDFELVTQREKDHRATIRKQEVEIKEVKDDLGKAKQENAANDVRISKQRTELDRRHQQIDEMHKIILNSQRAYNVAKENEQQARREKIDMENQLNSTVQKLKDVEKDKRKVERELAHQNWVVDTLIAAGVPVGEIVFGARQMPPIHAKILAVNNKVNLVMLSVGEDDSVKKGFTFTVYRGDKYVGKVEVEKVFSDMCSARILVPDLKPGMEIKEGDNAATRVYY